MPIRRLHIPVDCDGREVASISRNEAGRCILTVDIGDSSADTWGIMLSDLLRQGAISFELAGVADRTEIEGAIKSMLDLELAKPSDSVEQVARLRLVDDERTD